MKLSIVIPVFNDTLALDALLARIFHTTAALAQTQVVLVDDGSHAATWQALKQLKQKFHEQTLMLIRLAPNQGQQRATYCGICHATGDIIITMDADLQHPPEEITKLIDTMQQHHNDLVYATAGAGHPKTFQLLSTLLKWLLQRPGHNTDRHASAFRCIAASLAQAIQHDRQPLINIDAKLLAHTHSPNTTHTQHHARQYGQSSYTLLARIQLALRTLLYTASFTHTCYVIGALFISSAIALKLLLNNNHPTATLALIGITCVVTAVYYSYRRQTRFPPVEQFVKEIIQ